MLAGRRQGTCGCLAQNALGTAQPRWHRPTECRLQSGRLCWISCKGCFGRDNGGQFGPVGRIHRGLQPRAQRPRRSEALSSDEGLPDMPCKCFSQQRWRSITDLYILRHFATQESERVWERLNAGRLTDRDCAILLGMKERSPMGIALGQNSAAETFRIHAAISPSMVAPPRPFHALWQEIRRNVAPTSSWRDMPQPLEVLP